MYGFLEAPRARAVIEYPSPGFSGSCGCARTECVPCIVYFYHRNYLGVRYVTLSVGPKFTAEATRRHQGNNPRWSCGVFTNKCAYKHEAGLWGFVGLYRVASSSWACVLIRVVTDSWVVTPHHLARCQNCQVPREYYNIRQPIGGYSACFIFLSQVQQNVYLRFYKFLRVITMVLSRALCTPLTTTLLMDRKR
jgi:hypothetical protein